jgi:pimeloyl-ACP methyl ester carboxylesterase
MPSRPAEPLVLVPALAASARLYAEQLPELWRRGPVLIADHTCGETVAEIAAQILAVAPPRFALAGLSMGGYLAFELLRQAPERVERLALLDTSARPDRPEQTERRLAQIELAEQGRYGEVIDGLYELLVHPSRHEDAALRGLVRQMADDVGPAAFARQQRAIIGRPDSRALLDAIRCPTLVLVGEDDALTPPELAVEMADGIAGARLVVVPECGHLSAIERPGVVLDALLDWLAA